jgi:UDP-N-acetyl-D-mannosaminuronic acid dehydrogenase
VGRVIVVEPHISDLPGALNGQVELASFESAVAAADIVVLLVNHQEFLTVDRRKLDGKAVIDTRGVWR